MNKGESHSVQRNSRVALFICAINSGSSHHPIYRGHKVHFVGTLQKAPLLIGSSRPAYLSAVGRPIGGLIILSTI